MNRPCFFTFTHFPVRSSFSQPARWTAAHAVAPALPSSPYSLSAELKALRQTVCAASGRASRTGLGLSRHLSSGNRLHHPNKENCQEDPPGAPTREQNNDKGDGWAALRRNPHLQKTVHVAEPPDHAEARNEDIPFRRPVGSRSS